MSRRSWTPRDPEPQDVLAVVDNYGGVFICREITVAHPMIVTQWYPPEDPAITFDWPEMWDGYGGDWDVQVWEIETEQELAEVAGWWSVP